MSQSNGLAASLDRIFGVLGEYVMPWSTGFPPTQWEGVRRFLRGGEKGGNPLFFFLSFSFLVKGEGVGIYCDSRELRTGIAYGTWPHTHIGRYSDSLQETDKGHILP